MIENDNSETGVCQNPSMPGDDFMQAPLPLFRLTATGNICQANQAMALMFGYERPHDLISAVTGVKTAFYANQQDRFKLNSLLQKEGNIENFPCLLLHRDGSSVSAKISIRVVGEQKDDPAHFLGSIHRVGTNDGNIEGFQDFLSIFDDIWDAVFITNTDDRIWYVNSEAVRLTGYTSEELLSMQFGDLYDPEDQPGPKGRLTAVMVGQSASGEGLFRRKDRIKVHTQTRCKRLFSGDAVCFLTIARHIRVNLQKTPGAGHVEHHEIIGNSDPIKYVKHRIRQVASTKATVILTGETGVGKGVFARFIHRESQRQNKPFVSVNCASLPENLIESELFGREKGAFTGSSSRQIGRFELADGGTIFLDEIGELPLQLQAKLLRVLESGEFERLGSPHTVRVNVRVVACTNRDLVEEVKNNRFRKDLFFRLNAFPVTIPPLRQRKEDIPPLVEYYAGKISRSMNKCIYRIPATVMKSLKEYEWPGNVRELINLVERAVILSTGPDLVLAEALSTPFFNPENPGTAEDKKTVSPICLSEMERYHIHQVLQKTNWRIEGPQGAARLLNINPNTLRSRMKKLDISRPLF